MLNEKQKVNKIMKLGVELANVKDADVLLERILRKARKLVNAYAGSTYFKESDKLKFSYAQNETFQKRLPAVKKLICSTFEVPISNQTISCYVANTGDALNIPNAYKLRSSLPYSFNKTYDDRVKERWDETQIMDELRATSGTHFDPELVETFFCASKRSTASRTGIRTISWNIGRF